MKRFQHFAEFLLFLFIFSLSISYSQQIIESPNRYFNETIKEKLRVDLIKLLEEIRTNSKEDNQEFLNGQNVEIYSEDLIEKLVSGDIGAESELTAAINPKDTNNLIVSVIRTASNSFTVPIYYSKDFGKTWKKSTFAPLPALPGVYTLGGGDPVCIFDNNGVAHLTWISLSMKMNSKMQIDSILTAMHYAYSTDGGVSWNSDYYKSIGFCAGYSPNNFNMASLEYFWDKQWMAADLDPESKYYNNIYVTLSRLVNSSSSTMDIVSATKQADDNEFSNQHVKLTKVPAEMNQFSSNSIGKNGRCLVSFFQRKSGLNTILTSYSDDGGTTFSSPVKVSNFDFVSSRLITSNNYYEVVGVSTDRIYPCIYNASDNNPKSKYYGNSYIAWSSYGLNSPSTTGFDVYFALSTNTGESWGEPIKLSKDIAMDFQDQFYPAITVNVDGVIIISWYSQGVGGVKANTNYVVSMSYDGGKTFTEPVSASTVPSNFSTIGLKNNKFGIGEYNQVVATKGYAIPVWSDGRSGTGDLNVYASFIPLGENTNSVEKIINLGEKSISLNIYPNPSTANITVTINNAVAEPSKVRIIDLKGNLIQEFETEQTTFGIDLSEINPGVYFVEVINNKIYTAQKFIKVEDN